MKEIEAKQETDLEVVCIVTIPRNNPNGMTINLLGPIIINAKSRSAMQIICDKQSYSHQHPVVSGQQAQANQ
jgi:flagellar assembly factor FliW